MRKILKYDKWIAYLSIPIFVIVYGAFKPISKQNTVLVARVDTAEEVQQFILDKSSKSYRLLELNSYSYTAHQGYVESKFIIVMEK